MTDVGSKIMLAGIALQLVVMLIFVAAWALWTRASRADLSALPGPARRAVRLQFIGIAICSLMIIVRGFFRCVELGDGFDGAVAQNESLFLLDAVPVSIAIVSFKWVPRPT